jgi:CRISPR/Cas system type I-B associated protein Csh2 (Cas7 group RAMP superfamily)
LPVKILISIDFNAPKDIYKKGKAMKILAILISTLIISACTWVNENTDGRSVNVSTADRIGNCQKAGDINVSVASKIGFIPRGKKKIQEELLVLAKNEAVKLQADTIIPLSEPGEGRQQYLAYNCVK